MYIIRLLHSHLEVDRCVPMQARGIDIPMLDNVINFNFPSKSKLFVHRVGCVARASRSGTAYSFVAPDEVPYVLDLHLFLGQSLKLSTKSDEGGVQDGLLGSVPQRIIDEEEEYIRHVVETSPDLVSVYCGPHTVLDCALVCTYMHTYIHTCIRTSIQLVPGQVQWEAGNRVGLWIFVFEGQKHLVIWLRYGIFKTGKSDCPFDINNRLLCPHLEADR